MSASVPTHFLHTQIAAADSHRSARRTLHGERQGRKYVILLSLDDSLCELKPQLSATDEDLIKYAWPQDIWFHVDKLSSAHVYLRMPEGMSWEAIPEPLLVDCAQLVKANSIEGLCAA